MNGLLTRKFLKYSNNVHLLLKIPSGKSFIKFGKYQHLYRIDIQVYCYANYADLIGVSIFTGFTGRFADPDGL